MEVIAWGANPRTQATKGKKTMAKKKRSKAQRAATKALHSGNPKHGKKRRKNPKGSGKRKKHRRNPGGFGGGLAKASIGKMAMHGLSAGAGALAVLAINQAIVPQSFRDGGTKEAIVKGALALGLGALMGVSKHTRPYAGAVATGGIVVAVEQALAGPVLSAAPKNLLGEAYYLGELDVRKLQALGTTPEKAKPRLLGELDKRTRQQGGLGTAAANRQMIRGTAAAMEPQ